MNPFSFPFLFPSIDSKPSKPVDMLICSDCNGSGELGLKCGQLTYTDILRPCEFCDGSGKLLPEDWENQFYLHILDGALETKDKSPLEDLKI